MSLTTFRYKMTQITKTFRSLQLRRASFWTSFYRSFWQSFLATLVNFLNGL